MKEDSEEPLRPLPRKAVQRPVSLRDGQTVSVSVVGPVYEHLISVGEKSPHLLEALIEMKTGIMPLPSVLAELKEALLVRPDNTLSPTVQTVLTAGLQDTPEGAVVTNPIDLSAEGTRDAFLEYLRTKRANLRRLARWIERDSEGGPGSPTDL